MKKIHIGGVPEHFNLPWYLTLKNGDYKAHDINLRWHDYYGGTGQMCKGLRQGDIDMAVILTEGIVKDIIAGNPSKIIQTYTQSPLIWGIHVASASSFKTIDDIKGTRAAISRFGSGSHLMAYVNAQNNNWNLDTDLHFSVVKTLDGALEGLAKGDAEYFMWERFTTKPYVDDGTFRHIGNCPTPWPCFVIAAREEFLNTNKEAVTTILNIINSNTTIFKSITDIDKTIAQRYDQQLNDVKEWLSLTEWSQQQIDESTLERVQLQLLELGIIEKVLPYKRLVTTI